MKIHCSLFYGGGQTLCGIASSVFQRQHITKWSNEGMPENACGNCERHFNRINSVTEPFGPTWQILPVCIYKPGKQVTGYCINCPTQFCVTRPDFLEVRGKL